MATADQALPQGTVTPAGTLPRVKSFRVVGVFEIGMFEFDNGLSLITRMCFRQLDLAHFDALIWPTPGDIDSCTTACAGAVVTV